MKGGPGAWEAGRIEDQHPASQHGALPHLGGRREAGVQPVAHAPCWAETRKVPLRSQRRSAQKAAPPAGLAASLHSGLRSRRLAPAGRGVRSRGAPGAQGTRAVQASGCRWGAPLRAAPAFAPRGPWPPNGARPGRPPGERRRGADAPKRGLAGAGFPAPHDLSPGPPEDSVAPVPPTLARRPLPSVLGERGRVGLGPGAGLGADPEAGLSLRQDPARLPPVSLLSLLLPPPAPGGARHGGAGVRQARYGYVEIGEAWCGEVEWGESGAGRIGGLRDGETQDSRTRGRGGVPVNLGPLDGEGDAAGQVWNRQGRERTAVRRGAWEER